MAANAAKTTSTVGGFVGDFGPLVRTVSTTNEKSGGGTGRGCGGSAVVSSITLVGAGGDGGFGAGGSSLSAGGSGLGTSEGPRSAACTGISGVFSIFASRRLAASLEGSKLKTRRTIDSATF